MKKIEFSTRVRINGIYYTEKEISMEEIKKKIQKKVDDILTSSNYEKKSHG
ncbi:MAG: hypothetical protein SO401_08420 [Blautia sp.]|nr:hypothetical protein [Blautia sp.]